MLRRVNKVSLTVWLFLTFVFSIKFSVSLLNMKNDIMFYVGVMLSVLLVYGAGYFCYSIWKKEK